MTGSIRSQIVTRIKKRGRGHTYTSKDFLDLGSASAVSQGLARLVKTCFLKRVKTGVYSYPEKDLNLGKTFAPDINEVVDSIARKNNIKIMQSGELAALKLGLSTKTPKRRIFLTDGPYKRFKIDELVIIFHHASPKRMSYCGTKSETILEALHFLGKKVNREVIGKIKLMLSSQEKLDLVHDSRLCPEWLIEIINKIVDAK